MPTKTPSSPHADATRRIGVLHLLGQTEDVGGILSVVRNLQEATQAEGVEHRVWVHTSFRERRQPSLNYARSPHAWDEPVGSWPSLIRTFRGVRDLGRFLREEPVDVVHAHTRGGLLAGLGLWASQGRGLLFTNHAYARSRLIYRFIASLPRIHTVVLTPNMARHYGLPPSNPRLQVISACCADAMLEVSLEHRRRTGSDRPLRLVGLGTLLPWKNWHLLLEALALLPAGERAELRFEHWGETAQTEESQRYARELSDLLDRSGLGECVRFRGSTNAVGERLIEADWMVLPSTNEPCSVALSEALATGTPVLASRSGGNIDILEDGQNGLLFEPGSVEDLGLALRRILRGVPSLLPPESIRSSMLSRTATAVGRRYLNLYRQLGLARPSAGQPGRGQRS